LSLFPQKAERFAMLYRGLIALCFLAPWLIAAAVWQPEWRQFRIDVAPLTATQVHGVVQGADPARLSELAALDFGPVAALEPAAVLFRAREQLAGRMKMLGAAAAPVSGDFRPADLEVTASAAQLNVASLVVPDLYLRAAQVSGEAEWLAHARSYLHRWWEFEQRSVLPAGLQWNDHAVAARVLVLTRYWNAVRAQSDFESAEAPWILEALSRSAALLLKPEFFTFRTNHGFMENLALLHVAACFPRLPVAERAAKAGAERLRMQLKWYLSPEGMILEHSAGYHEFGTLLTGAALKYFAALQLAPPDQLAERYESAKRLQLTLLRDDDSLPALGDTLQRPAADTTRYPPPASLGASTAPVRHDVLAALSGLAVWWSSDEAAPTQSVVSWSNFATQAHKHADDLGLLIWQGRAARPIGVDWITATGYWPYDSAMRDAALGWRGSNGPHWVGESPRPSWRSELVGAFADHEVHFLHGTRTTTDGARIDRQIVEWEGGTWLVLDSGVDPSSSPRSIEICWTFGSQVSVQPQGPSGWLGTEAGGAQSTQHLAVHIAGSGPLNTKLLTQSAHPFGGWVMGGNAPVAATTLETSFNSGGWHTTLFRLGADAAVSAPVVSWRNEEDWSVHWSEKGVPRSIARSGFDLLVGADGAQAPKRTLLKADRASLRAEKAEIDKAYTEMAAAWPEFRYTYRDYRTRMTWLLAAAAVVQLGVHIWLSRSRIRRQFPAPITAGLAATLIVWAAFGFWLVRIYFA
jgi:hypothetical protein